MLALHAYLLIWPIASCFKTSPPRRIETLKQRTLLECPECNHRMRHHSSHFLDVQRPALDQLVRTGHHESTLNDYITNYPTTEPFYTGDKHPSPRKLPKSSRPDTEKEAAVQNTAEKHVFAPQLEPTDAFKHHGSNNYNVSSQEPEQRSSVEQSKEQKPAAQGSEVPGHHSVIEATDQKPPSSKEIHFKSQDVFERALSSLQPNDLDEEIEKTKAAIDQLEKAKRLDALTAVLDRTVESKENEESRKPLLKEAATLVSTLENDLYYH